MRPNSITGVPHKARGTWTHTQRREGHMKAETQREEGRQRRRLKEASKAKEPTDGQ